MAGILAHAVPRPSHTRPEVKMIHMPNTNTSPFKTSTETPAIISTSAIFSTMVLARECGFSVSIAA